MKIYTLIFKAVQVYRSEGFRGLAYKVLRKIRYRAGQAPLMSRKSKRGLLKYASQIADCSEVTNRYDVLVFSIVNWDFRFQRPQQVATRFAQNGHRVFYVSVDLRKQPSYTKRELLDNIYEITLPFEDNCPIYNVKIENRLEVPARAMRELFENFCVKEAVVIAQFPNWYPLAFLLAKEYGTKIIFDCLDDFSGFSDMREDICEIEQLLVSCSDLCIATSTTLYEKLRQKADNVILVRNATEFDHFHNLPSNNKLKNISKPIIGYYGAIAEWFDISTIEHIASRRPDWSIVLIGNTFGCDIRRLRRYKNVHLLGERPYAELPEFLYWFDVCVIPFRINELTLSTNPVKFYEFISSGKPVVASKLPELVRHEELLYLSESEDEFLRNIQVALEEEDPDLRIRRICLAQSNDWNNRFCDIQKHIKSLYPLVSIIVVTYNNAEYTKMCVSSIFAKTAYPNLELIIVDNASTDETRSYLEALRAKHENIKIILNSQNIGLAAANNTGIRNSTGKFLILLNNDTIVTRGWISGLIKYLIKDPAVGMVGPVTNSIGNEAKIDVSYKDLSNIDVFAEHYTKKNRGKTFEIAVLAMYCVALSKQTIDKVGLLDERFSIGMFEDDDYALRVARAGLKVLCTEDVFIHHFGGVSFNKLPPAEYQRIFNENKKKFEKKMGITWQAHRCRDTSVAQRPPKFRAHDKQHGFRQALRKTIKKCEILKRRRSPISKSVPIDLLYGYQAKKTLEKHKLQIVPFNFYSPIPSIKDIEAGWETKITPPFFEPEIYDNEVMKDFLVSTLMPYAKEFDPPKDGDEDSTDCFFWNNSQFSNADALALYCFVRHLRPKTVLEIGGGFSTLIIDQAIRMNGFGEIWEVEPYPRWFLRKLTTITRFFAQTVQELPLSIFDELQPGDILFIDSTHTVKASSDCTFIYLKGLKRLKTGVFVHSHDIYLPGSLPKDWHFNHQLYWAEHYLLQALLIDNSKFKVIFGSNYHHIYNKKLLDSFVQNKAVSAGGSFWYKRI
jgi:GT2 family glycosyltransferase